MDKKKKKVKKVKRVRVKKVKELSLVTTKKTYAIDKPFQMVQMATLLKEHIVKNELYASIAGKNYVMVEGWQFAGGLLGMFPRVVEVKELAPNKWMAEVEIINQKTDKVVGTGFALCSKTEKKKANFDEYAILSMAQTRAIGKAYRNLIGWIMKIAGYESTPAEEMSGKREDFVENDKITKVIQAIKAQGNRLVLAQWRNKIGGSKIYTKTQKEKLILEIDERIKNI